MIDQFMDVDGRTRVALVATIEAHGTKRFIGVAHHAMIDDPVLSLARRLGFRVRLSSSERLMKITKKLDCGP